jgi:hypothetical protein
MFSVFPNFHIEGPTPCAMVTTMFSLNFFYRVHRTLTG